MHCNIICYKFEFLTNQNLYRIYFSDSLILQIYIQHLHQKHMSFIQLIFYFIFIDNIFINSQITKSEHATSGVFIAYHNQIASMPQSVNNSYVETFGVNFTTVPLVVAGLNNYKMFDFMYYQNMQFHIHSITQTNFQIFALAISSTNIRKFSVSYLGIQNLYNNMFYFQKIYDDQGNIYLGSGNRLATIVQNFTLDSGGKHFNSNNTLNSIIPIMIGFFVQTNTVYDVQIDGQILDNDRYSIQLSAYGDCLLHSVRLGIFLINNLTLFTANSVYFDFGYKNIHQNDTTWTYNQLPNVDYLLGLINFYSPDAPTSKLTLGWSQSSATQISILLSALQTATYLYIAYGHQSIIVQQQQTNSFPIAAVIVPIVIITIIIVGVVVFKKYFSFNKGSRDLQIKQSDEFLPQFF